MLLLCMDVKRRIGRAWLAAGFIHFNATKFTFWFQPFPIIELVFSPAYSKLGLCICNPHTLSLSVNKDWWGTFANVFACNFYPCFYSCIWNTYDNQCNAVHCNGLVFNTDKYFKAWLLYIFCNSMINLLLYFNLHMLYHLFQCSMYATQARYLQCHNVVLHHQLSI